MQLSWSWEWPEYDAFDRVGKGMWQLLRADVGHSESVRRYFEVWGTSGLLRSAGGTLGLLSCFWQKLALLGQEQQLGRESEAWRRAQQALQETVLWGITGKDRSLQADKPQPQLYLTSALPHLGGAEILFHLLLPLAEPWGSGQ